MNEKKLLKNLREKSKELMKDGKHFHDFAHIIGVYKNVEELLKYEKDNRLALLTAALFHDVKRDSQNHGTEGAIHMEEILKSVPGFPTDLIKQVSQIIKAHDKTQRTYEEKLFYDADKMEAFNELATARSFMMYAKEGLTLKEACFKYSNLIDHFYNKLHTKTAKRLVRNEYKQMRIFVQKLLKRYEFKK